MFPELPFQVCIWFFNETMKKVPLYEDILLPSFEYDTGVIKFEDHARVLRVRLF